MRKNVIALLFNQAVNILLPLLLIPYLVRTLGLSSYGKLALIQVIGQYFIVLVDYGHSLTAPRAVAQQHNSGEQQKLSSQILWSRLFLTVVSVPLFALTIVLIPSLRGVEAMSSLFFLSVLAYALYPYWYFQGLEKMAPLTQFNVVTKIAYVGGIFLLVKDASGLGVAIFLQGVTAMILSASLLTYAYKNYGLRLIRTSILEVYTTLRNDWTIFVSQFSSVLFGGSNIFILGLFAGSFQVGQYAVAERIVRLAAQLTGAVSTALYPRVSALMASRRESEALSLLRRMSLLWGSAIAVGCAVLWMLAPWIVQFIQGTSDAQTVFFLQVLALVPLLIFVENIFATQILLGLGYDRIFLRNLMLTVVVSLTLALVFVPRYGAVATAWVSLISQLLILLLMYLSAQIVLRRFFKKSFQ